MEGKICPITGGTKRIGQSTAWRAQQDAELVSAELTGNGRTDRTCSKDGCTVDLYPQD
jgi:hypothetical protein